eukprot:g42704.t1
MAGQMTVNQARNAVRTAAAQGQERPTAAVTPIQAHSPASPSPAATVAAQQVGPSQHPQQAVSPFSVVTAPAATRPTVALTSATAAVTPPNISATTLEGDSLGIATTSATASTINKVEKESREKQFSHEQRLDELGLFSLKQRKLSRDLIDMREIE